MSCAWAPIKTGDVAAAAAPPATGTEDLSTCVARKSKCFRSRLRSKASMAIGAVALGAVAIGAVAIESAPA